MNAPDNDEVSDPKIAASIVIPACNAVDFLPHCMEAVRACKRDDIEVIVVDDASTDDTAKVAEELGLKVLRLSQNSGPSRARNRGAKEASAPILLFVDADVCLHPDAIDRVLAHFDAHPETAALFGSYDTQPKATGTLTQYRNLVHHFVHQQGQVEASTFWAGCGAVRREVFLALGGFDETGYPRCIEDIELGYRLRQAGYAIHLDKQLLCTHLKRWTLLSMIRTDVYCRALPWIRLNRSDTTPTNDLNLKAGQKASVALVGLVLVQLALGFYHPIWWAGALAALCLVLLLNAPLFQFFARQRGAFFMVQCIPMHLLYFLYSGFSFFVEQCFFFVGIRIRDGNTTVP